VAAGDEEAEGAGAGAAAGAAATASAGGAAAGVGTTARAGGCASAPGVNISPVTTSRTTANALMGAGTTTEPRFFTMLGSPDLARTIS
jgi:hypothetical protein